ncbi:MAG: HAMP domain-containing protein, partial [Rhodothermales bacterium]|nr:HAMP domain-containing protein [Rhodothermales bacterium]
MDLYILPDVVVTLCYAVLLLSFAAYLILRHRRSVAARWLAAFCIAFILTYGVWYVPALVLPMRVGETMSFWVYFLGMAGLSPFAIALQQFVYAFRGNPYPREARVLLLLTGGILLFVVALYLGQMAQEGRGVEPGGLVAFTSFLAVVLISLWTIVVAARKTVRFSRDAQRLALESQADFQKPGAWSHLWHPRGRAARACRAFAAVMCFPFLMMFLAGLQWGVGLANDALVPLLVTCVFAFLYSINVAYVTYTPEATTVQVKLVGTVLATVLLLLALVGTLLIDPVALMLQHGGTTPAPHTLRFEPDGRGGYAVTRSRLDPAQAPIRPLGERLPLGDDDEVAVPVGFAFPFYGAVWDSMSVSANGAIGLGGSVKGPRSVNFVPADLLRGAAKLAPLFTDFTAAPGGVFVQRTPEQAHVTWHEVGLVGGAPGARYTLRATLDRSGAVTFAYATPAGQLLAAGPGGLAGRGLAPGGDAPMIQALDLEAGERVAGAPGAALAETFAEPVYREAHRFGRKLLILLVAATLFCLLALPLVFRASLLRPLAHLLGGLQEVEKGHLDTAVHVPTHDEVGQLAQHFNAMTHTLREAEHQLREYAATLEHRV